MARLCCPRDGVPLRDDGCCSGCGRAALGSDGILRLMPRDLHRETEHEMRLRDGAAAAPTVARGVSGHGMTDEDLMEIEHTMRALDLRPQHVVLELGAGTGRFTRLLQDRCKHVVAVEVSLKSLQACRRDLGGAAPVPFAQADAAVPFAVPRAYDRILGTLASNLPDSKTRMASYRMAARACKRDGLFVFSTHHYCIRSRLAGHPREGRYQSGIFRSLLTAADIRRELEPFWGQLRVRPIVVVPPLARRLRLPLRSLDRIGQQLPLLRDFGELLLVEARQPAPDDSLAA